MARQLLVAALPQADLSAGTRTVTVSHSNVRLSAHALAVRLRQPRSKAYVEAMTRLDVPGLIHSAGSCSPRESYTLKFINEESIAVISLLGSDVFDKFPNLKIVVAHAGGAIPYQMGRFRSWHVRKGEPGTFDDKLKRLHFDTCNYDPDAIALLLKVVGVPQVLFGTEKPGTGSARNPATGRDYDDMKPVIEGLASLSEQDRADIFECNCRRLYTRAFRRDDETAAGA